MGSREYTGEVERGSGSRGGCSCMCVCEGASRCDGSTQAEPRPLFDARGLTTASSDGSLSCGKCRSLSSHPPPPLRVLRHRPRLRCAPNVHVVVETREGSYELAPQWPHDRFVH
ncbi:unnamed protein product, partial [Ixodes hexagonus]